MSDFKQQYQDFITECIAEEAVVHKTLQLYTMQGMTEARKIWEAHFGQKYCHGVSVKRDIARVNVMRRSENQPTLC